MPQSYAAPSQVSNAEFLQWSQGPDNTTYPDPATFNLNSYTGNGITQAPYDQSVPATSTQLARRPINRQLVPTGQRPGYDNTGDPWGQFGDDSILDSKNPGAMEETDSIEALEEKATAAKREAQAKRKQIPPFVQKLSSFLEESRNTDLIRWSDRGDSFVVLDEDEFAKTLIPELFKHNNYPSFVRQLNMYGFHKRVGLSDNSMKASERKNKSPSEYYNPYFKRGHPNLLWLINKPKGGGTKSKKKQKNEGGDDGDSDDENREIEEVYGNNIQNSRALSAAPESGPLQKRDVAALHNQLAEIQKQQNQITTAIQRLQKNHNQLYQQSVAFQTLHDRHENSINAILTFLATVYNRSLDGQGPQNIAEMFTNGIPHNVQQQGNVVDIGDVGDITNQSQQNPGNLSPLRRQQRLLMAPPTAGGRAATATPSAASTPQASGYPQTPQPGAIEELFETSPPDSTQVKPEPCRQQQPSMNMMNIINNTNAQSRSNNSGMEFPEMLSHYENANGNSPLTSDQRNDMLNLIANSTSAPGTNNALVSPIPPQPPNLEELSYTQAELDAILRLQENQQAMIEDVKVRLAPLSPSGSIPGLDGNSYFNGTDSSDPNAANLDLDQFLDSGAFYSGSSPMAHGDYNYDHFNDGTIGMGDSHFDIGMDGVQDSNRVVETADGSEAATPEPGVTEAVPLSPLRSPSKRRRRN